MEIAVADLASVMDQLNQLGTTEKQLAALLDGMQVQLSQTARQLQAIKNAGSSPSLDAISDSIAQLQAAAETALRVHGNQEATQMSETTGDPSNPVPNPAPGNPDVEKPQPDGGETGDSSNPIQNPPAPNADPENPSSNAQIAPKTEEE